MNSISICVAFILCFTNLSGAEINHLHPEDVPPNNPQLEPQNSTDTTKQKATFSDLNDDILFLIFERFELRDLLKVTKAIPSIAPYTEPQFRQKYGNHKFTINIPGPKRSRKFPKTYDDDYFHLKQLDFALDILTHFGHLINYLHFCTEFVSNETAIAIIQGISKYCSGSLTSLDMDFITENTLKEFTVPFNVKELKFGVNKMNRTNNGSMAMNEIFPKLEWLEIELYEQVDYSFMDMEFPHLKQLDIYVTPNAWKCQNQIERLIMKNLKTIRNIGLMQFPSNYAENIQQMLPDLETLKIDSFETDNETLQFEHVKHFEVYGSKLLRLEKLSFPKLESIEMGYFSFSFNMWTNFFELHPNIQRIYLYRGSRIPLGQFGELFHNLVELTIDFIRDDLFETSEICQFVEQHALLTKFHLLRIYSGIKKEYLDDLRDRLGNDWRVAANDYEIRMERNN